MEKICRLCLKRTEQNKITKITSDHLLQLHIVIPEIDLNTVKSPLICTNCVESLKAAYNFKSVCLETEKRLESKIKSGGVVNLEEILKTNSNKDNLINKNKENVSLDDTICIKEEEEEEINANQQELNDFINDISGDRPSRELIEIEDDTANTITTNKSLKIKSLGIYERQYQTFMEWCESVNVKIYSENVFLTYFNEKAKSKKSSTLWSIYSMLKATFMTKHNIDISVYSKLTAFIKQKNLGYCPKQSNVFNQYEICKFLEEAPDEKYLMWKICMIFGIAGACRTDELKNMMTSHINDKDNILLVKVPDTKTNKSRIFTVTDVMYDKINPIELYRKYLSLRPSNIKHNNFFIYYSNNKCTIQPIGIHTIGKIPSKIASYLHLKDPKSYTGHAFRRTSSSLSEKSSLVSIGCIEFPPIRIKQEY